MSIVSFRAALAVASFVLLAGAGTASATDVFNMGGVRDPQTGQWTGTASLEMVPVGDPGNVPDTRVMLSDVGFGTTGYGQVNYAYNIGKYDVTAAQYTAFLNAVAKTDTYGLYTVSMANPATSGILGVGCGIVQSGTSGGFGYSVNSTHANFPVTFVSWGDAARFCNWLSNGQPSGAEGPGTTETGSYTLSGATTDAALITVTRNAGATYVIPTENEWYKAAYYKGGGGTNAGYWLYPTQSNSIPSNVLSAAGTNNGNYYDRIGIANGGYTDTTNYLTAVGAFADSPSAYGTFDQGGDVFDLNDAVISFDGGLYRGMRGGSFTTDYRSLMTDYQNCTWGDPSFDYNILGFRVAEVPEPASLGILSVGVVGLLARRRHR